jgi:hypothetical protein
MVVWRPRRVNSSSKRMKANRQAVAGDKCAEAWTAERREVPAGHAGMAAERLQLA